MTERDDFGREFELMTGLPSETVRLIPRYALRGAMESIRRVQELTKQSLVRPGVYYVVLCDLCNSTLALEQLGHQAGVARIQAFILASVQALAKTELESVAFPLKEAGDAMLLMFTSFSDIYRWWSLLGEELASMAIEYSGAYGLPFSANTIAGLHVRTVIHLGEIAFTDGVNPVALAVSQVFKMEKQFDAGELGCTEVVKDVASPVMKDLGLTCELRSEKRQPADQQLQTFVIKPVVS
jgi:hypothetical protein